MSEIKDEFVIKVNRKKYGAYLFVCVLLLVFIAAVILRDFGLIEKFGIEQYIQQRETIAIKLSLVALLLSSIYMVTSYFVQIINKESILEMNERGFDYRFNPYDEILWKDVVEIKRNNKRRNTLNIKLTNFDNYMDRLPQTSKNLLKRNCDNPNEQIIKVRIMSRRCCSKDLERIFTEYWKKYNSNYL